MGKLDGKVAIITGASFGIGEEAAKLFVKEGAKVVIADIEDGKGRNLANELGSSAEYIHTDVASERDVKNAVKFTHKKFGRLDIMYSNAGNAGPGGPIEGISVKEWNNTVEIHLTGYFLCIKHSVPIMKNQGGGVILGTSSICAFQSGFGTIPYSAAKAGIIQLTRDAAVSYGPYGIRINAIAPGRIITSIYGAGFPVSKESALKIAQGFRTLYTNSQTIPRPGEVDDIAKAALFLVSDDSSYVTGVTFPIEGGILAGRVPGGDPQEVAVKFYENINSLPNKDKEIMVNFFKNRTIQEKEEAQKLDSEAREKVLAYIEKMENLRKSIMKYE